jgi:phospholipase/carboxylesterase/glyoxalase family protein
LNRDLGFIHRAVPPSASVEAAAPQHAGVTLLLLHGTGGNEDDLIPLGRELDNNAALLSPRGKVLEGALPRFFRRLAEGVFDVDDLKARTHELGAFVRDAQEVYGLGGRALIAVGFSNGANIAGSLLFLDPLLLQAAVLFRPMVPFNPDPLPDLSGTPVFIAAGLHDPIVPPALTAQLEELLTAARAKATVHWEPAGHSLTRREIVAAKQWLAGVVPNLRAHPV